MKTIKQLEVQLLFESKQSNEFRMRRSEAKTQDKKKAWQILIDLADKSKDQLKKQIETMKKAGLKKPTVKGITKMCASAGKVAGLKVDGTLKKGYKYAKGGKIVKVVVSPSKKKVVKAKKTVAKKKPATKKKVVKKKVVKK